MSLPTTPNSDSTTSFSVHPGTFAEDTSAAGQRFIDRRNMPEDESGRPERRQFGSSHTGLSANGRELALAIDEYKIRHHRRYLTCDEMLSVLGTLGYVKQS